VSLTGIGRILGMTVIGCATWERMASWACGA